MDYYEAIKIIYLNFYNKAKYLQYNKTEHITKFSNLSMLLKISKKDWKEIT